MNPNNNPTQIPTIPISVDILISPQQSAILAMSIFAGILFALLIFGFVFKK